MKKNFTMDDWGDDVLSSKDIIDRYEELDGEYQVLVDNLEEAEQNLVDYNDENPDGEDPVEADALALLIKEAQEELDEFNQSFEKDELDSLREIIKQGESSSDWYHGEQLIHEDYFTKYTEELVDDCYEYPEEFNSGRWPFNHLHFDFEAAANELKSDYIEITAGGHTYYIHS